MLHQHTHTIPGLPGDFSGWHRGRKEFTIWMIELDQSEVLRKVEAARTHLAEFLLTPYERQPHITLFVCGFLSEERRFDDDYSRQQLDAHCRLLEDSGMKPFEIAIHGLGSFASAPFLQVQDREGGIERVRAMLQTTAVEIERDRFTPHVTVGLYSGAFASRRVLDRIEAFTDVPISLKVDRITFAAFDSSDIRGPLAHKRRVLLKP